MVVFRCTAKLLTRLRSKPVLEPGTSTGALGDWYATLLHTHRGTFVLAIAGASLLPIVVTGRELLTFPTRVSSRLAEVLAAYRVPAEVIERECAGMAETCYARTDDRSTVGVLTELLRLLDWQLKDRPNAALTDVSLALAETPIVARHTFPGKATCRVFGVPPVPPRWLSASAGHGSEGD